MDIEFSGALARIVQSGTVTDSDVAQLRDIIWSDDTIAQATVDALFMLANECDIDARTWDDFFHEAVEHFLLHQQTPHGFLSQENADWLHERIDRDGSISSHAMIELLVSILETAENAPERLKTYALSHIEEIIVTGGGTSRTPKCVTDQDAALIRRLIFAHGGEEATIVSTGEADMLFRIKDATLRSDNASAWKTLFIQGVGNHLMAHSDYRPLSAEEAKWFVADAKRNTPNLFGFFKRTLPIDQLGQGTIVEALAAIFPEDLYPTTLSVDSAHAITADEAGWLKEHIAADGQTDDYEKALLTFVIEEAGSVPASLTAMLRQA